MGIFDAHQNDLQDYVLDRESISNDEDLGEFIFELSEDGYGRGQYAEYCKGIRGIQKNQKDYGQKKRIKP